MNTPELALGSVFTFNVRSKSVHAGFSSLPTKMRLPFAPVALIQPSSTLNDGGSPPMRQPVSVLPSKSFTEVFQEGDEAATGAEPASSHSTRKWFRGVPCPGASSQATVPASLCQ